MHDSSLIRANPEADKHASGSICLPRVLLVRTGRLRAQDCEHRRRVEPEALRTSVQGRGDPGQQHLWQRQVQNERDLRHAQAQRHSDGTVRV